jgi:hypothetical protein
MAFLADVQITSEERSVLNGMMAVRAVEVLKAMVLVARQSRSHQRWDSETGKDCQ